MRRASEISDFKLEFSPAAQARYFALPYGTFQRVRSALQALQADTVNAPPERQDGGDLPGVLAVEGVTIMYVVEWNARTVRVFSVEHVPAGRP